MPLSAKQKRYLRGLGHHIEPVLKTGKEGLSETVLQEIHGALEKDELIKVKIGKGSLHRKEAVNILEEKLDGEVVQLLGKNILLFRQRKKESTIRFPK
ncbi:MAG: ribosome assembly RNA-binding protein YhbY [Myxococcota bacterium]|nr:ribosome assembly RNA-binding protein YhbY [Myxococcota bacterium]